MQGTRSRHRISSLPRFAATEMKNTLNVIQKVLSTKAFLQEENKLSTSIGEQQRTPRVQKQFFIMVTFSQETKIQLQQYTLQKAQVWENFL